MAPPKTRQPVIAYTARHRIEGELVLLKGERLSDKLNEAARAFEPLLDARVYALDAPGDAPIHEAESLALAKAALTLMLPAGEARPA